jgi:hypothetical protein
MRKLWKLVMLGIGALALSGCFSGSLELQAVIHTDPILPPGLIRLP